MNEELRVRPVAMPWQENEDHRRLLVHVSDEVSRMNRSGSGVTDLMRRYYTRSTPLLPS